MDNSGSRSVLPISQVRRVESFYRTLIRCPLPKRFAGGRVRDRDGILWVPRGGVS